MRKWFAFLPENSLREAKQYVIERATVTLLLLFFTCRYDPLTNIVVQASVSGIFLWENLNE